MLASFVTLTYDPEFLPRTNNGFATLNKSDVQKFIKRLRKTNEKKFGIKTKIIYYVGGEYGSHTKRPHYHLIIFNAVNDAILSAWKIDGRSLGHVHIGSVSDASIGYCLKYINKKLINKKTFARDDRKKEFQLSSKGIGLAYLTPQMIKWHQNDPANRCLAIIEDNKKISLPRYFRNKIFNEEHKKLIQNALQEIAMQKEYEDYLIYGNNLEKHYHDYAIDMIDLHNYKHKNKIDSL